MKHPHAELMKQYAEDAVETDKPWERWEYQRENGANWYNFNYNPLEQSPMWLENHKYRRKPEPEEVLPPVGTPVWARDSSDQPWQIFMFIGKEKDECDYKYCVQYSTNTEDTLYFKYMTTENPCKPAV